MLHSLWNFDRCLGHVTLGDGRLVDDIVMGYVAPSGGAEIELIRVALPEPALFGLMHRDRHLDSGEPVVHPALADTGYFDALEQLVSARTAPTSLSLRDESGLVVPTKRILIRLMDADDLQSPELRRMHDDAIALWDLMYPPKPWWNDIVWPDGMSDEHKADFIATIEADADEWEKGRHDARDEAAWRGDSHDDSDPFSSAVREVEERLRQQDERFLLFVALENASDVPSPPSPSYEEDDEDDEDESPFDFD